MNKKIDKNQQQQFYIYGKHAVFATIINRSRDVFFAVASNALAAKEIRDVAKDSGFANFDVKLFNKNDFDNFLKSKSMKKCVPDPLNAPINHLKTSK